MLVGSQLKSWHFVLFFSHIRGTYASLIIGITMQVRSALSTTCFRWKLAQLLWPLPRRCISSGPLREENTSTSTESATAKWDKAREVQALRYTLASQAHNSWLGIINRGLGLPSSKCTPLSSSHCRRTARHPSTRLARVALPRVAVKDFWTMAESHRIKTKTTAGVKMRQQANFLLAMARWKLHSQCGQLTF